MKRKQLKGKSSRLCYKNYDYSALLAAYKHCKEHNTPVKTAARMFGVPPSTLNDRVSGKTPIDQSVPPVATQDSYYKRKLRSNVKAAADESVVISECQISSSSASLDDSEEKIIVIEDDRDEHNENVFLEYMDISQGQISGTNTRSHEYIVIDADNTVDTSDDLVQSHSEENSSDVQASSFVPKISMVTSLSSSKESSETLKDLGVTYKNYTKEAMLAACLYFNTVRCSMIEAAAKFGVPSSTLRDKIKQGYGSKIQPTEERDYEEIARELKQKHNFEEAVGKALEESIHTYHGFRVVSDSPWLGTRKPYKQYSESALIAAALYIREQNVSVSKAARMFGIPQSTLKEKMKRKRENESRTSEIAEISQAPNKQITTNYEDTNYANEPESSDTSIYINIPEEGKIMEYINLMAKFGYFLGKEEICSLAKTLESQSMQLITSNSQSLDVWYNNFIKRCSMLTVDPENTFTPANVKTYFLELHKIMIKHQLFATPELVYKIDEIGIFVDNDPKTRPAHLLIDRNPGSGSSKAMPMFTLIGCGNALGTALPPYFLFSGKKFSSDLTSDAPPGTQAVTYLKDSSTSILRQYITGHFNRFVQTGKSNKGVILLYSGHSTFLSLDDIEWARRYQIYLYVLPPHTCKESFEPFDVGLFGQFQTFATEASAEFTGQSKEKTIAIQDVTSVAGNAYYECLSWKNLASGFKKCGVYPFNPNQFISCLGSDMQLELYPFNISSPENGNISILPSPSSVSSDQSMLVNPSSNSIKISQKNVTNDRSGSRSSKPVIVRKIQNTCEPSMSKTNHMLTSTEVGGCSAVIKIEKNDTDDEIQVQNDKSSEPNFERKCLPMKVKMKRKFSEDGEGNGDLQDVKLETYIEDGIMKIGRQNDMEEDTGDFTENGNHIMTVNGFKIIMVDDN